MLFSKMTKTSPLVDKEGNQAKWNIYIKKYLGSGLGAPSSLLPKDDVGISNQGTALEYKICSMIECSKIQNRIQLFEVFFYIFC